MHAHNVQSEVKRTWRLNEIVLRQPWVTGGTGLVKITTLVRNASAIIKQAVDAALPD